MNRDEFFAKLAPVDAEQRVTFRRLATAAQSALHATDSGPAEEAKVAGDFAGWELQQPLRSDSQEELTEAHLQAVKDGGNTDAWAAGRATPCRRARSRPWQWCGNPGAAAVCESGGMSRRLRRMPSRSWCVRADRQSSILWAGSFLAELGKECGAPFLEGGELGAELFELAVDAG